VDCCRELAEVLDKLFKRIFHMPQTVQITVNFNIAPAPAPPVATPSTVTENLTVGQAAPTTPVSVVSGGVPPYTQPIVDPQSPNQLPPGLTAAIDGGGNVTITGTPAANAAGAGTVLLDISDSSS
jgi:hypothetical protein